METEQKSNGALIGLIIIIIILIIGGLYFWKKSKDENAMPSYNSISDGGDSTADLDASVNSLDLDSIDNGI